MNFEELIGNKDIKEILEKTANSSKELQSYLFYGTEGIGKRIFAINFAKMILCSGEEKKGKDNCKSCAMFETKNHPDFFFIEPDGNSIKINQIRLMQKSIIEKNIISRKKVYIINDADKMTKEAQNALLKTLEEPQKYVVIILIASNENAILNTVKSRCTKIFFNNISDTEISQYLKEKLEDVSVEEDIIYLCNGSIGKCNEIIKKQEILKQEKELVEKMDKINKLQLLSYSEFFNSNKADINLLLDYFYILLFGNSREVANNIKFLNAMSAITEAKNKLLYSNNYDMTIDNMLLKIWEEINEKNHRG